MKDATVYFDGACPLCAREIGFYRRCAGAERIAWVDLAQQPKGPVADGLTRDAALARFHVRGQDGLLVSGGAAFAQLWSHLPAFRPVGILCARWPFSWLVERAYMSFLRVRPLIKRVFFARRTADTR